ncbi:MAG: fasciclin domain-containing protein [Synechococcales bacterium]|nr:fasciclin domain-containing protein [Synechococcales bacterium]
MNRYSYTQFGKLLSFFSAGLLISLAANANPTQPGYATPIAPATNVANLATLKSGDGTTTESTPVESKSVEGTPVNTQATELKPTDTKPTDTKPTDTKPTDADTSAPVTPAPVNAPVMETTPATAAPKLQTIADVTANNASFKTLNAALQAAGLTNILANQGPFTVFAPTDEAFAALPKGTVDKLLQPENKDKLVKLLTYHVVSGEVMAAGLKSGNVNSVEGSPIAVKVNNQAVMVNNARVTTADVKTSNGVIHVIDKVIVPPLANAPTQPKTKPPKTSAPKNQAPKILPKNREKPVDKPVDKPADPASTR